MSEREELFDMARSVIEGELGIWVNGSDIDNTADSLSYAILAAGYRKPRTITTEDEIEELPLGTVLLSSEGGVWLAYDHLGWREPGSTLSATDYDIALPATVLYEPTA